jgi:hypothetical protein
MARTASIPSTVVVATLTLMSCVVCVALSFYLGLPSTSLRGAWSAMGTASIVILGMLLLANRRRRFGLHSLLFAVAIICIAFATLSIAIDKSRKQR